MMDLGWYLTLNKPIFTPPSWLFAPVWSVLYILIAVSFFLVWKKGFKKKHVKNALKLFVIQFILNLSWSPIFFGLKNISLALIVIIIMWVYILKTILAFGKVTKTASYLLYPYIVWVSFAAVLNFSIWLLNK